MSVHCFCFLLFFLSCTHTNKTKLSAHDEKSYLRFGSALRTVCTFAEKNHVSYNKHTTGDMCVREDEKNT